MTRLTLPLGLILVSTLPLLRPVAASPHDIITTPVTWDREVSRIFFSRCVACHRENGMAFPMMQYRETFPWRTAIKEEVLERRMPPWGAVKGFGDFRNDQALTPEQLELLTSWAEGGSPEGDPKDVADKKKLDEMVKESIWSGDPRLDGRRRGALTVTSDYKFAAPFVLDGIYPTKVPEDGSFQILAEFPNGRVEPLLWLDGYKRQFEHVFLLRTPIEFPAGAMITGVPAGSTIVLLPPGNAPGE